MYPVLLGLWWNRQTPQTQDLVRSNSSVRVRIPPASQTLIDKSMFKRLIFILVAMICSMGMFGQSITISDDCLSNLPEETQRYVREHAISSDSDDSSIGTEIGIAVNETFKAISDNTIKLAESNLGKSAIFMLSWKILYRDIIGLIVGIFLLVTVAVIMIKVLNQIKKTEDKNNGDFTETSVARVAIGCVSSIIFFISSMFCIF